MRNEHLDTEHVWACMQVDGNMGEIKNFKNLSAPQLETVTADPSKAEEICPGGTIVCSSCEITFLGREPVISQAVDFDMLKRDLVIPSEPATVPTPAAKQP